MWVSDGPQEDDVVDSYIVDDCDNEVYYDILEEHDVLEYEYGQDGSGSILGTSVSRDSRRLSSSTALFGSPQGGGSIESLDGDRRSKFSLFSPQKGARASLPTVTEEGDVADSTKTNIASSTLITALPAPMASLINTSRPLLMPSLSGQYLILYWSQSLVYMVISMRPRDSNGANACFSSSSSPGKRLSNIYSSSGLKCLKDCLLMRGMCYGISWAGSTANGGEILAIIDPPVKVRFKYVLIWTY